MVKKGLRPSITDAQMYEAFAKLEKRGPENSHFLKLAKYGVYIGFHRLAIMDPRSNGDQPFVHETPDKLIYSITNGEIYNFKELETKYNLDCKSGSDCEIFPQLYHKIGIDSLVRQLNGEYAFIICDIDKVSGNVTVHVSRDQCGIRPLFMSGTENEIVFTSELKGSPFLFSDHGYPVEQFPPRTYLTLHNYDDLFRNKNENENKNKNKENNMNFVQYIRFEDIQPVINDLDEAKVRIHDVLVQSVRERIVADRPIGCLLSGGLDSSLVASITAKLLREEGKGRVLHTFSIGIDGSEDKPYALMVAEHIGSIHHHVELPEEVWLSAINEVIGVTETYDITTIRATVAQFLICRWIAENTMIKVVLCGDISDEVASSYLYFLNAPSSQALHEETIRLLNDIHRYDVLRCDRGVASNGLEVRVPYGSLDYIGTYLSVNPELRVPREGMEKWLLREAFNRSNYLPSAVLWRTKCAFSDGCSSKKRSWYTVIQERVEESISDEDMARAKVEYDHCVPEIKEALFYRREFERIFGSHRETAKVVPYFWLPKWCGDVKDPSARVLGLRDQ